MSVFSSKAENRERQVEVDLLRGFAGILVIIVHVGLYLGNDISAGLWTFCDMAGSEPCAPVLMTLMGISMVYSRCQDGKSLLRRGVWLLMAGYALSFFRSLLPLLILGKVDEWASIEAFFVVDILQFAGLTFLFIALLKKLGLSHLLIFVISIAMVVLGQWIMLPDTLPWNNELLTGIVNLFCPVTEWSCFPFLTWFVFPAFGLVFGDVLTHCVNKNKLYGILLPIGFFGTVFICVQFCFLYPDYTRYYWGNNFYYMGLKNVLLTLLFICFALSFWFFASKILPDCIKKFLRFLSKNLNNYYVISWIIISVLIHAQAVCNWRFGTWVTIGIMVLMTVVSAGLTKLWLPVRKAFKGK